MKPKLRDIPRDIEPYFDEVSQFKHYCEHEKNCKRYRDIEDKFICLKGFSSSTPLFNSAAFGTECLGGGFYFRYNGHGIVVDPGIGFISLMHRNNIFISDIDTVIVTHAHLDHNCDVLKLSAMEYDYYRTKDRERSFFKRFFQGNHSAPKKINWYMDEDTIRSTHEILEESSVHTLSECCDGHAVHLVDDNIVLRAIRTEHIKDNCMTYGIKLSFISNSVEYKWGYTSDTRFFSELGQFFKDSQVLIFNISDIYPSDVEGRKSKRAHLGFDGSLQLLQATQPPLALVSEFCCTNGDYRHEITRALRTHSGICILPSDPGLMISIGDKEVTCSLCGKSASGNDIKVAHPVKEFGDIQYICPHCLF